MRWLILKHEDVAAARTYSTMPTLLNYDQVQAFVDQTSYLKLRGERDDYMKQVADWERTFSDLAQDRTDLLKEVSVLKHQTMSWRQWLLLSAIVSFAVAFIAIVVREWNSL